MEFNRDWREARDELVALPVPRITYGEFAAVCEQITDQLTIMKETTGKLLEGELRVNDPPRLGQGLLSEPERSGVLALHAFLRRVDPHHERLGLKRLPTYTGDFVWLCETHYQRAQPKMPQWGEGSLGGA